MENLNKKEEEGEESSEETINPGIVVLLILYTTAISCGNKLDGRNRMH